MKIGVDLKPFNTGSKYRGIGVYSRELINELINYESIHEFHYLNIYQEYDGDPQMNEKCFLHQYYSGPKIIDVGERQLFRDVTTQGVIEGAVKHFIEKSDIDVMLFTSPTEYGNMYVAEWFQGVFKVGILYDLIPLMFPEQCLFDTTFAADYEQSLKFLQDMDLLLAISQSAKEDAIRLLGIPEERIVVIYAGIDKEYKKNDRINIKELKSRYQISDAFIMFAGGIDFKKNIDGLITAYAKCGKSVTNRYQLVIVGKTASDVIEHYMQIARDNDVEERVICTGFIPKEDLIALYNITDLMVFPSLYEGFGLPVIEAMACGARVITSNVSSLKEIADGYATLISPGTVKSITNGILDVLEHPVDTLKKADIAAEYAKSYTWKKTALAALTAIEMNFHQEIKPEYTFKITEKMLKNIAKIYAKNNCRFSCEDKELIAEQLLCLEAHKEIPLYNAKNRLLFDVTVVHEWMKANYTTGIGRVSKELYAELRKRMRVIPVVLKEVDGGYKCNEVSLETFEMMMEEIEVTTGDIFFMPEIQLRGVQVSEKHPRVQYIREKGAQTYAVVYDILPLRMPEYFEKRTSRQFELYIEELIENYDGILCDSRFVADDLIAYCKENSLDHLNEVKIGFFHLGQDTFEKNYCVVSELISDFFSSKQKTYLMIGTIEPRKGHEIILRAFEKMWKNGSDSRLCIIGHVGWNMQQFIDKMKNHSQIGKKLAFFEAASDGEVCYAYENAFALIQASAGEGFGLPLIEASNYNLPILCSDIEVFHEVAGTYANYFNRESIDDIIYTIEEFEAGRGVFNSKDMYKQTWKQAAGDVYNMIVEGRNWYGKIVR